MAVTREASGWRRTREGEQPDAVVSRVFGPDTFAVVTNGEIDGLDSLTPGAVLGVRSDLSIGQNGFPTVAKVVSPSTLLVNLQSYAGADSNDASTNSFVALQQQIASLTAQVAAPVPWSRVTETPTTLNDYGITNGQPLDSGLTSLAGLTGAGYVKATATDSFTLSATIPWADVSARPTTLAGYGITDALTGTLTTGRVALSGGAATVTDSANLTYSGSQLTNNTPATGAANYALTEAGAAKAFINWIGSSAGLGARNNRLEIDKQGNRLVITDFGTSDRVEVTAAGALVVGTDPNAAIGGVARFGGAVSIGFIGAGTGAIGLYSDSTTDATIESYQASNSSSKRTLALNKYGGSVVVGTDPGGSEPVRIGGALRINSATLIATSTSFTNGAGASAGTLTNAPVAGNPTKWIPINDNGTTRYIPAW